MQDAILWAAERWRKLQAELHDLGGLSWFDRRSPQQQLPAPTAVALIPISTAAPVPLDTVTESTTAFAGALPAASRTVPDPALLADTTPVSQTQPPRSHRIIEIGAWFVTACNLVALLVSVLWWPAARPEMPAVAAADRQQRSDKLDSPRPSAPVASSDLSPAEPAGPSAPVANSTEITPTNHAPRKQSVVVPATSPAPAGAGAGSVASSAPAKPPNGLSPAKPANGLGAAKAPERDAAVGKPATSKVAARDEAERTGQNARRPHSCDDAQTGGNRWPLGGPADGRH